MNRRPCRDENEQDILKMQEEYLREKSKNKDLKPSAQLVRVRTESSRPSGSKRGANDGHTRPQSKYAQTKGLNYDEKRSRLELGRNLMGDVLEKNYAESATLTEQLEQSDKVNFPNIIPCVLKDIVEKNVTHTVLSQPVQTVPCKGFPVVKKRDLRTLPGSKSIFAQQIERECTGIKNMEVDQESRSNIPTTSTQMSAQLNVPDRSFIVTSEVADSVHRQNIEVLNTMSEHEILEEQKKLMVRLDPQLIKFLKSRRESTKMAFKFDEVSERTEEQVIEQNTKVSLDINADVSNTLWESDILYHPNINNWLHFDSFEKDKLQWIKGIEDNKIKNGEEPYEARFDFKGYLLPYAVEYNEQTKTLFHHGEEPHRPGYSLLELFELSRSSIIQQRAMALNTIAGVLDYHSIGIYKDVIEIPVTKIFFVIRFALDENKVAILEPALRAMRNLLYNRVDEAGLDALLAVEAGLKQPCLEHNKSEIAEIESKESELKDYHLADIDLITGILRTDILQRLHYILNTVKPTLNCVQYCLQILTRVVRDSVDIALLVVNCTHLMACIIEKFLPVTGINFVLNANVAYSGKPVLAAVKLIRVLCLQSPEVAHILITKYNILEPISAYVSSEIEGTYSLKIQMEALAILTNLFSCGVAIEKILALAPLAITSLYKHVNGTDIYISSSVLSATHAAVLIQLVNKILTVTEVYEIKLQAYPLVKQGLIKWLSQLSSSELYSCSHLRLLCATLDCASTIIQREGPAVVSESLETILKSFSNSKGFKVLLKHLIFSSNLLSNICGDQIHSIKNLTSLSGSVVDTKEKVLPVLRSTSPILFLISLVKLLDSMNSSSTTVLIIDQMWFYLTKLRTVKPSLCENWFTRVETEFLFYLLKVVTVKVNISESEKDLVYAVANKTCYILRSDKIEELHYLFQNIVFNKNWFTAERLLNLVSVSSMNMFTKTLSCIEQIRMCYSKIVNMSNVLTKSCTVLKNWQEPILPRDWIYFPIVKLYTEHQNTPEDHVIHTRKVAASKEAEKELIVSCCLEWILFNELCFDDLLKEIDLTDRFCRLMCVFLCDNSLFLDKNIKVLLEKCIQTIFRKEKELTFNFDKDLTGIYNFQDFYTQLIQQFQAVSYSDHSFAACVLVPLAQKHNVKWRKHVWSEYAGCLRAAECPEQKLCYDISEYLYPEETDESLIKSYLHALSTNLLRPHTVPFKIASHHVNSFWKKINLQ